MDRVSDYIICNRKKYGGKPFRPYIKEYPTRQPKPLAIPHWVDPNIIDNTNSYSGKRKFKSTEIWPKCETTLLKFSVSTDLSVLEHTPWQYLEEEGIPYTVQFSTEDNYYPNNHFTTEVLEGFRATRDYFDFSDTPSYTGAEPKKWDSTLFKSRKGGSILKIRWHPLVDNSPKNLYRQVDNSYIRGRASREKEIERQERVRVQGHRRRVRYELKSTRDTRFKTDLVIR
jgi:hypothetical protein